MDTLTGSPTTEELADEAVERWEHERRWSHGIGGLLLLASMCLTAWGGIDLVSLLFGDDDRMDRVVTLFGILATCPIVWLMHLAAHYRNETLRMAKRLGRIERERRSRESP